MKIVADDKIPYIKGVLEPFGQVCYMPGRGIAAEDAADADVLLVRTRTHCGVELLAGSKVGMIATATIGTDHIDLPWCAANGIEVVSAPGCNAGGVLQWVAAVLARTIGERGIDPRDVTLGIVGVGHVGSLVERYARQWGFRVLCSDPPRESAEGLGRREGYVPLYELAANSDIVTFHVPMTAAGPHPTLGLGGEAFFESLKPGTIILNSSRGGVLDETLLKKAIVNQSCSACIDTWENEPDIDRDLLDLSLFATPHIAGYSRQGKAKASAAVVEAVSKRFSLPLQGWYPPQVSRVERIPISWKEMCAGIGEYFDIGLQSWELKENPQRFERIREDYKFREEFF